MKGAEAMNEEIKRRLRRLHKPDGNCAHCERPADQYNPVGPVVVKSSEPDDCGDFLQLGVSAGCRGGRRNVRCSTSTRRLVGAQTPSSVSA